MRYFDYHKISNISIKYFKFARSNYRQICGVPYIDNKVVLVAGILQLKKKLIERYLLTQYIIITVSIRVKDGDIQSVLFPHTVLYTIVNFKRSKLPVKNRRRKHKKNELKCRKLRSSKDNDNSMALN